MDLSNTHTFKIDILGNVLTRLKKLSCSLLLPQMLILYLKY